MDIEGPKVFILIDSPTGQMNFLKAQKYGKLHAVFKHNLSPTFLMNGAYKQLCDGLCEAKEGDYLVPVGPPALIAMAGQIWLERNDKMKILTWDRQTEEYYVVEVNPYG